MTYITSPIGLPALAEQHWDAFQVMRYQLQDDDALDDERLDALVSTALTPILAAVDCIQCGNCCHALDVYLEAGDAQRLAEGIHVPLDAILTHYVTGITSEDPFGRMAQRPCQFLRGTLCSIYEYRPQTCRDYPFVLPDFRWMLEDLIAGSAICPIIYNTLVAMESRTDDITAGRL